METNQNKPAPRTPLSLEVSFKKAYARLESKGELRNISLSGAFLEIIDSEFRPNEKLHLKFTVGGRERMISASVIWKNSSGCGVKFNHHSNRDRQIIDDLIYYVENSRSTRRSVMDNILKKVAS